MAEVYGRVTTEGLEAPPQLSRWFGSMTQIPGWRCFAAFDGDDLVAAGAMYLHDDTAALSGAAALEAYQGRGAQRALLEARLRYAAEAGATGVTTETGSETEEDPNPSLHNIHWARVRDPLRSAELDPRAGVGKRLPGLGLGRRPGSALPFGHLLQVAILQADHPVGDRGCSLVVGHHHYRLASVRRGSE